jgi:hypothetical protein
MVHRSFAVSQASLVVADWLSYTGLSASVAYDVPVHVGGSSTGSVGSVAMSAGASSPVEFRVSNSFSWDVSDLQDHMSLALSSDLTIPEVVSINVTDSIGYDSGSRTYTVSSTGRPTSSPTTLQSTPTPTLEPTYSPTVAYPTTTQPTAQPTSHPTSKPTQRTQKPTYSAGVPTPSPSTKVTTVVSISQVRTKPLLLDLFLTLCNGSLIDSVCTT